MFTYFTSIPLPPSLSLISLMFFVGVMHHVYLLYTHANRSHVRVGTAEWVEPWTYIHVYIGPWLERPAQTSGAILTRVRVPGAARDFSPKVSSQCRLSYGVPQPPCATACTNIRVHVTNPKHWQPDTQKYCTH